MTTYDNDAMDLNQFISFIYPYITQGDWGLVIPIILTYAAQRAEPLIPMWTENFQRSTRVIITVAVAGVLAALQSYLSAHNIETFGLNTGIAIVATALGAGSHGLRDDAVTDSNTSSDNA